MQDTLKITKKRNGYNPDKIKRIIFIASVFTIPIVNFLILNIGQLVNLFVFVFQEYVENEFIRFPSLYNFIANFNDIFESVTILHGLLISLEFFAVGRVMSVVSILISYYVYKKFPGSSIYRSLFVMPGMITGFVWVGIFRAFVADIAPILFNLDYDWLSTESTILPTLILYGCWLGLAGNLILYVGTMSGISQETIEAGEMDGTNMITEVWHIILPGIWPILQVNFIGYANAIFMSGPPLFEFYRYEAPESLWSISYFLTRKVLGTATYEAYGYSAANSFIVCFLVAPLTFTIKHLTDKFGPSDD